MWPTKWIPIRKLGQVLPGTLLVFGYRDGARWVVFATTDADDVIGDPEYTHFVSIQPPPRRKA